MEDITDQIDISRLITRINRAPVSSSTQIDANRIKNKSVPSIGGPRYGGITGTSTYDATNNRLGINQSSPASRLHINNDGVGVTQSDANGIILQNSTPATIGLQQLTPAVVFSGQGFATTPVLSKDVRVQMYLLPVQGAILPSGTLVIRASVDGAAYGSIFTLTTVGGGAFTGTLSATTYTGSGNIIVNGATSVIRGKGYTVAGLPAGTQGDMAFVTDALAPTFLGALTGGSSTVTPVFYNGGAWVAY